MTNKIYPTLKALNLSSDKTRELYASGTRDNNDLRVWRDTISGVIFIEDHYVGENAYSSGLYRSEEISLTGKLDYEDHKDCLRRVATYKQFYINKNICDFGCGAGSFIQATSSLSLSSKAIELQEDYRRNLNSLGVSCHQNLDAIPNGSLDTMFCFHALEHLPDPITTLKSMKAKLKKNGIVIIEVPHANDFLLNDDLNCEAFKPFTLWSQHLILHTRLSLRTFLEESGFSSISIEGVQRFPLSNHLTWLAKKVPGGHKSVLSNIDTPALCEAYEAALNKIDATDTLVAIASN